FGHDQVDARAAGVVHQAVVEPRRGGADGEIADGADERRVVIDQGVSADVQPAQVGQVDLAAVEGQAGGSGGDVDAVGGRRRAQFHVEERARVEGQRADVDGADAVARRDVPAGVDDDRARDGARA